MKTVLIVLATIAGLVVCGYLLVSFALWAYKKMFNQD